MKSERAVGRFFDDDAPRPLAHDRAAGRQIFEALKMAILYMDIAPGSLISEGDVGRRFSASRTPVREALMQLREAGLVITSMGRGNFATKLSEARIKEARFIREVIELGVIDALCDVGLGPDARADLAANLTSQRDCIAAGDKHRFRDLDDQFHLTLAQATGSARMADILEREKMVLDRLRVLSLSEANHMQRLYGEHQAILDAIDVQNHTQARWLMKAHLTSVLDTLSTLAQRHKEYFE